ncbi:MAG: sugar ABC transporter permease [Ruminococcaceae bacterium]|nr:sugar ABC transporter permease [Oscillospiraceae bacterium]
MKKSLGANIRKYWFIYLIAIMVLSYYLLFCYGPLYGVIIAFKDYKPLLGIFDSKWVGFENFASAFSNENFWLAVKNTLIISTLRLLICFWAPLVLAIMLNEMAENKIKKTFQTMIYLPHFISWVILGGIITMFLSPSTGLINKIIEALGGEARYFLMEESSFLPVILISDIWKNAGWGTIVYIAAINTVNPELYEAASMDGASRIKQILHIMIPNIMPIISLNLIIAVANILSAGFDQIIVFQNNYNRDVSAIIDTYVYDLGIKGPYKSEATAVGLAKSVISTILLVIADQISKKKLGQRGII